MLVNFSNHASETWSEKQYEAAMAYGGVIDISFPEVPAEADESEISIIADNSFFRIMSENPTAVLVQGEMSLSFAVVRRITAAGIPVICACSKRCCETVLREDGSTERKSVFKFIRFREYEKD